MIVITERQVSGHIDVASLEMQKGRQTLPSSLGNSDSASSVTVAYSAVVGEVRAW